MDLNRSMLGGITRIGGSQNIYKAQSVSSQEAWQMTTGKITDKKENLTWLL